MTASTPWYKKPWFIVLAVLIVGIGFGLIASNLLRSGEGEGSPAASGGKSARSSEETTPPSGVDGCLGGPDLGSAVTTAQKNAPLTDGGLAAFARTVARWMLEYPLPPDAENTLIELTGDSTRAASMVKEMTALASELEASGYSSATVDLSKGGYRLSSTSVEGKEGELAELELLVYRKTERAGKSEVQRMVLSPDYKIKDGHFTLPLQDPEPPADRPDTEFTPFAGGC